jgi:hypothetical protein
MSRRTRAAAVLLSGAALIAGAPAGAQAHGDRDGKRGEHRSHHHHRGVARELGVTKEQLRTALKAVAEQQQSAPKPASLKELLAQQLQVTPDQVRAAFRQAKENADTKEEFVQAFAAALQIDPARVQPAFEAAFKERKAQWKARRDAFFAALAQQLNRSPEQVEEAFDDRCGRKHHR